MELCVLSVCAWQVGCSADSFRFPQGCNYEGPSFQRRGAILIFFVRGCKASRRYASGLTELFQSAHADKGRSPAAECRSCHKCASLMRICRPCDSWGAFVNVPPTLASLTVAFAHSLRAVDGVVTIGNILGCASWTSDGLGRQ